MTGRDLERIMDLRDIIPLALEQLEQVPPTEWQMARNRCDELLLEYKERTGHDYETHKVGKEDRFKEFQTGYGEYTFVLNASDAFQPEPQKKSLEELTTILDALWSKSLKASKEEKVALKKEASEYAKLYAQINPRGYRPPFCR